MNQIRPIAICVFRQGNKILVAEGHDPIKNQHFYRPLGGGIEFGEASQQTICRELMEEVHLEVDQPSLKYLGALENIFEYNGTLGHEVVIVYDGALRDREAYQRLILRGREANGEEIRAVWKELGEFGEGKLVLYPAGLLALLN